jgi:DNA polymerase-3 subunit epsilon
MEERSVTTVAGETVAVIERQALVVITASDEEAAAHVALLEGIAKENKGRCVWLAEPAPVPAPAPA